MNHFSVVAMGRLSQDHPGVFRQGEFQGAMGSVQGMAGLGALILTVKGARAEAAARLPSDT
jgi:hypothetical protein